MSVDILLKSRQIAFVSLERPEHANVVVIRKTGDGASYHTTSGDSERYRELCPNLYTLEVVYRDV